MVMVVGIMGGARFCQGRVATPASLKTAPAPYAFCASNVMPQCGHWPGFVSRTSEHIGHT